MCKSTARTSKSSAFSRVSVFTKMAPSSCCSTSFSGRWIAPGEVTGFVVHAADKRPPAIAEIRRQIEALDPEIAATPCAEFVSSLTQMKIARTMSWFTSTFAIVIGAIGVMNTMAMSVFERRGEIASLRAMGWRKWRVVRLILSEVVVSVACRRRSLESRWASGMTHCF